MRLKDAPLWMSYCTLGWLAMLVVSFDTVSEVVFLRRAISLASHNVREEYTIHLRNSAPSKSEQYVQSFDFLLHKEKVSKLSYLTGYSEMLDPNSSDKGPTFDVLERAEVPPEIYSRLSALGHAYTHHSWYPNALTLIAP
jgi:hypothetical protein